MCDNENKKRNLLSGSSRSSLYNFRKKLKVLESQQDQGQHLGTSDNDR